MLKFKITSLEYNSTEEEPHCLALYNNMFAEEQLTFQALTGMNLQVKCDCVVGRRLFELFGWEGVQINEMYEAPFSFDRAIT